MAQSREGSGERKLVNQHRTEGNGGEHWRTEVPKGIDLSVVGSEVMVILGPSGCGKTTLLRIVAGFEQPTSREVLFSGERVTAFEPKERNVAIGFQNYALYSHMTAYENQAFSLKLSRYAKPAIARS